MAFLEKRKLSGKESPSKPIPKPPVKEDTSIFGGRPYIPMSEVHWRLRKASPFAPGFPTPFSERERIEIAKEIEKKAGPYYLKKDVLPRLFRELEREKSKAPTVAEKMKIERKIRFLKRELMGQ